MNYEIKDINLAEKGKKRIIWAEKDMPVLAQVRKKFEKEKPLKGLKTINLVGRIYKKGT